MDREAIRRSAVEDDQVGVRMDIARFTSKVFREAGTELHVVGHLLGTDRRDGMSPFGHGDDATVAISMLLRIASELVSGSAELIHIGQHYAGSALIRQLVEVEYLSWAFETQNEDATRWLCSNRDERREFFTPAKLRAAAKGHFRSVDYGYHCELGGHPVPGSWVLLRNDDVVAQLMLSDCLGHTGRIWDHVVGWAKIHVNGAPVLARSYEMMKQYSRWKEVDKLVDLPPPPSFPPPW